MSEQRANNQHGYTLMDRNDTPLLKWEDILDIIHTNRLELLGRSSEQRRVYREFREKIELEWESLRDYVLCTKFSFNTCIGPNGKLSSLAAPNQESVKKILPNDFPYHFEDGKLAANLTKITACVMIINY
jgi:hypothetical protein